MSKQFQQFRTLSFTIPAGECFRAIAAGVKCVYLSEGTGDLWISENLEQGDGGIVPLPLGLVLEFDEARGITFWNLGTTANTYRVYYSQSKFRAHLPSLGLIGAEVNLTVAATGILGPWAIPRGTNSIQIAWGSGGTSVAVTPEYSLDGGTTWNSMLNRRRDSANAPQVGPITAFTGQALIELDCGPLDGGLWRLNVTGGTFPSACSVVFNYSSFQPTIGAIGGIAVAPSTSCRVSANANDGATSWFHQISASSTNAAVVKSSGGQLSAILGGNVAASFRFLKIYNKSTTPVPGTDTPIVTLPLPPSSSFNFAISGWSRPSTGIGIAVTGGIAVSDTTAILANETAISINYT